MHDGRFRFATAQIGEAEHEHGSAGTGATEELAA
jgi:hypothetical protein